MASGAPNPENLSHIAQRSQIAAKQAIEEMAKRAAAMNSSHIFDSIARAEALTSLRFTNTLNRQLASMEVLTSKPLLDGMNRRIDAFSAIDSTRWLDALNRQVEAFQANRTPLLERIERQLSGALPAFERWRRHYDGGLAILTSRGWWPHPDWPISLINEVVALKREKKLRRLDNLICDAYAANRFRPMSSSVKEWLLMQEFHEHRRQINAGFKAYKRGDYVSAVNDWLPPIEPIWLSLASELGLHSGDKDKFADAYRDARSGQPEMIEAAFFEFFSSMYDNGRAAKGKAPTVDFPINRHRILHGLDTRAGTRANAMRLFLVMETLHYMIREYKKHLADAA